MKKILTVFAVFLFTAFSVFAEMDFHAGIIYQSIFDSQYEFEEYFNDDVSDLKGELYKHGEIGGDIAFTYFLNEEAEKFQAGVYCDVRYLRQYTGSFYFTGSGRGHDTRDLNDLTGHDLCASVGIKGRYNFNRILFGDFNAGLVAGLNFYSTEDEKYDFTAGSLGAEIGGDFGFRVLDTNRFSTAIKFGANGKVGFGSGTIDHKKYRKGCNSSYKETGEASVDLRAGVEFMLKGQKKY